MRTILFMFALAIGTPALGMPIGAVTDATGDVRLLRGDAYYRVGAGIDLNPRDVIKTGARASAQLEMADGSVFRLGPDTWFVLSDYQLDPDHHVVAAAVDVLDGSLRFAITKLRPQARYTIASPQMILRISVAEGILEVGGDFALEKGAVDVTVPAASNPAPIRVIGGQLLDRCGQRFLLSRRLPERLSGVLRSPLQRRLRAMPRRSVPPRLLYRAGRHDLEGCLRRHPDMRPASPIRLGREREERVRADRHSRQTGP